MPDLSRRAFLKLTATAAAVGVVAPRGFAAEPKDDKPKLEYRILGRTGLKVTTVSLGCMVAPEEVIGKAVDAGINFLDTAHVYSAGRNEHEVGRVLKARGRDKAYICTKVEADEADVMLKNLNKSLERLQTDYVDVLMMHGARNAKTVKSEEYIAPLVKAKKDGKARFIGVSTHENMPEVIDGAVEAKVYDVVLTAYNFVLGEKVEGLTEAIARAKKANVGVIAMKTQRGGFKTEDGTLTPAQAALKWALDNENVSCAIPGMRNFGQLEQNLAVMGRRLGYLDRRRLERFAAATRDLYCTGCGACAGTCPRGVSLPGVRRCAMYLDGYGDPALARENYRALDGNAAPCAGCGSCTARCVNGVALRPILLRTHERLA